MKLFCVPHAGGSARAFDRWRPYLRRGVESVALDLPSARTATGLPFAQGLAEIAERVAEHAAGGPYVLYGHSLGGLLTFETVRRLGRDGRAGASVRRSRATAPSAHRYRVPAHLARPAVPRSGGGARRCAAGTAAARGGGRPLRAAGAPRL
ncbi:thioesterase II family protein [Streptomyces rhizosphaerihabitans]|uniref:thioesterase II family protein n=1 Tax=Streptomyces rhizosphaerihabitans TaxID=1266770 RepID=UPI003703E98D